MGIFLVTGSAIDDRGVWGFTECLFAYICVAY